MKAIADAAETANRDILDNVGTIEIVVLRCHNEERKTSVGYSIPERRKSGAEQKVRFVSPSKSSGKKDEDDAESTGGLFGLFDGADDHKPREPQRCTAWLDGAWDDTPTTNFWADSSGEPKHNNSFAAWNDGDSGKKDKKSSKDRSRENDKEPKDHKSKHVKVPSDFMTPLDGSRQGSQVHAASTRGSAVVINQFLGHSQNELDKAFDHGGIRSSSSQHEQRSSSRRMSQPVPNTASGLNWQSNQPTWQQGQTAWQQPQESSQYRQQFFQPQQPWSQSGYPVASYPQAQLSYPAPVGPWVGSGYYGPTRSQEAGYPFSSHQIHGPTTADNNPAFQDYLRQQGIENGHRLSRSDRNDNDNKSKSSVKSRSSKSSSKSTKKNESGFAADDHWDTGNKNADDGWQNSNDDKKNDVWGNEDTKKDDWNSSDKKDDVWGSAKKDDNWADSNNDTKKSDQGTADETKSKTFTRDQSTGCAHVKRNGSTLKSTTSKSADQSPLEPIDPRRPFLKHYWFKPKSSIGVSTSLRNVYTAPAEPLPAIPPSVVTKTNTSHQVRAGEGSVYYHRQGKPSYVDNMRAPYAVFAFRYRSREMLEKILGGTLEAEKRMKGTYERKMLEMSKEELFDELRRAKKKAGYSTDSSIESDDDGGDEDVKKSNDQTEREVVAKGKSDLGKKEEKSKAANTSDDWETSKPSGAAASIW